MLENVCGKTRCRQRHSETWWWHDEVAKSVEEKRRLFKIWDKSKRGTDRQRAGEDRNRYIEAKRDAKREIAKAKEVERRKFGEFLDKADEKGTIFKVAKQVVRNNRDVIGGGCIKVASGKVVVDEQKVLERWREY